MAATVAANARTLVHAASRGLTVAFPDPCKTPAALGAPLPYPNLALSRDAAKTARRTTADGQPVCLASSEFARSTGDEPGSGGGVVSQTIRGPAAFVAGSSDVVVEGTGVARALDLLVHNRRNTPPFPVLQPPLPALPVRAQARCLRCDAVCDPARPGPHVPDGDPAEAHRERDRSCDGGACLWAHRPGCDATSCGHRWQAAQAVEHGLGARYGRLPGDAFRSRSRPFWHDVHHLIPPRLLHATIDQAAGSDLRIATYCRRALLEAGCNLNHGRNLLILPLLAGEARRFALPRRLVLDAATVGIPPALAGAFAGVNAYDLILEWLLTPIVTALAATCRPAICRASGPAPGAVAVAALDALSDLIRRIVTAPNHALDWAREPA